MSSTYTKPKTNLSEVTVKKIIVFAMTSNDGTRRIFEDAYAQKIGSKCVSSHMVFNESISNINKNSALVQMKKDGFDSALIVKLVNQQHSGGASGPHVSVDPSLYYRFGGGLSGGVGVNISPGYNTRQDFYSIQSSLYELEGSEDLLWSGTTQVSNPNNVNSMADDVAAKVVGQLQSAGVL